MRKTLSLLFMSLCLSFGACADEVTPSDDGAPFAGEVEPGSGPVSDGPEIPEVTVCGEDYSLCGHVMVPGNLGGSPRSLVVALYTSLPPMGPPSAVLTQIEAPSLNAGEQYPVRIYPMLEKGEYFIWVNLYMEGGGEWMPINGVDYTGASAGSVVLDGESFQFDDIYLDIASGW